VPTQGLTRRRLLQGAGVLGGLALARGLGAGTWGRGMPEATLHEHLRALARSLTPGQRERLVLPADHPSREIVNTISVLDRPHLGTLLSPSQLARVEALLGTMLSPSGCADFAPTLAVEGRFEGCILAIYGEPESDDAHIVLQGGHVMIRRGDASDSPFGGGTAYGHQIGNHRWRVEGNSFAYHGDAANRLMDALRENERAAALQDERPHELVLQPLGDTAAIPGVRFGALTGEARAAARSLVDTVLSLYPDAVRSDAWSALDANGGFDALHFATFGDKGFYADMRAWSELPPEARAARGSPYWQVWRIEGPGAVFHFQGHPHVHAYVHIVRDPGRTPVGETLASSPRPLQGAVLSRHLSRALAAHAGEAFAWHGSEVPGRIPAGTITTGSAFALDPYANRVVVATLAGAAMAEPLRKALADQGHAVEAGRAYRVATTDYAANDARQVGEPTRIEDTGALVRDALIQYLRRGGLATA
jgi:hypothetical protein